MKNASDVLQRMQLVNSSSTADGESLTHTFLSLSQSEQQKYQQLLDLDVSVEQLQVMLKKRAQKPDQPAVVIQTPPSESHQYSGMSLAALSNQICHQVSEENSLENIHQEFLALPAKPLRTRRKSTNEKRPAAPRNRTPKFNVPEWIKKTPPIIQKLEKTVGTKGLPVAVYEQLLGPRKVKNMRPNARLELRNNITVISHCLFTTMNLTTLECKTYGEGIAEQCGLTPPQVSRTLDYMVEASLITKELTRGANGRFLPMKVSVTPLFLKLMGIGRDRLTSLQKQHQLYSKPANRKVSTLAKMTNAAAKIVCSAAQAVANFRVALRSGLTTADRLKLSYTEAIVRLSDEFLKAFGLGCYGSSFSAV